ncbi:hypothetical protein IBTHAUMO2_470008 [Nitrosopumilaceae archaeon]|nr:hypothetical protein IBTHAUMO2_470008 [Nitrosopumilaceae archaeon]
MAARVLWPARRTSHAGRAAPAGPNGSRGARNRGVPNFGMGVRTPDTRSLIDTAPAGADR